MSRRLMKCPKCPMKVYADPRGVLEPHRFAGRICGEPVTGPYELLGYYVEWGPLGRRKRGTVVAWKADGLEISASREPDAPDVWHWINPGIEAKAKATPKSRFAPPGPDAAVVLLVQQVEGPQDHKHRETWKEIDIDDFPQFVTRAAKRNPDGVTRRVDGLTILKAPPRGRA